MLMERQALLSTRKDARGARQASTPIKDTQHQRMIVAPIVVRDSLTKKFKIYLVGTTVVLLEGPLSSSKIRTSPAAPA